MTPYDGAMAILFVAGLIWGAWRGITWQLASLGSLIVGYSVSHPLSAQLAPHFPGPPIAQRSLAMLAIYVAVSGGIFFAAWLVRATLRQMQFEAFDRHLGMVLGGLEAIFVGMVVTLFVVSFAPDLRTPIFSSPTGHAVAQVMDAVGPVLPTEIRGELARFWSPSDSAEAKADAPAAEEKTKAITDEVVSLRGALEQAEKNVGKAIADEAKRDLQGLGNSNDRAVERR